MPKIVVMNGTLRADGVSSRQVRPETYHWLRIVSPNGEIMLDSEDYSTLGNARRAARRLAKLTGWEIK